MAWVTMRNKAGDELYIPEPVYENMFKDNENYYIVPEPSPKTEEIKKEEIKKDDTIPNIGSNENSSIRKSTKKVVI